MQARSSRAAQSSADHARKPLGEIAGVGRTLAIEHPRLVVEQMRGIFLEGLVSIAERRQRDDEVVTWIDLQDRLRTGCQTPGASQHLFELTVGTELGGDEADGAVGQTIRRTHVGYRLAERGLDEGEKVFDRVTRLRR